MTVTTHCGITYIDLPNSEFSNFISSKACLTNIIILMVQFWIQIFVLHFQWDHSEISLLEEMPITIECILKNYNYQNMSHGLYNIYLLSYLNFIMSFNGTCMVAITFSLAFPNYSARLVLSTVTNVDMVRRKIFMKISFKISPTCKMSNFRRYTIEPKCLVTLVTFSYNVLDIFKWICVCKRIVIASGITTFCYIAEFLHSIMWKYCGT